MKISMIVAMGTNHVIGFNNKMPWHLPNDLNHFKQTTLNHPVVMGRKTFQSIGRPLPQRRNVVISKSGFLSNEVEVVGSLDEALDLLKDEAEIFIIGGGTIYEQMIAHAHMLYVTEIEGEFEGDTYFPKIDSNEWNLVGEKSAYRDEKNSHNHIFKTFERIN